jgi:chlorobactene lauroyltransferase
MVAMDEPQPEIPANHKPVAQEIIYHTLVLPSVQKQFHRVRVAIDGPVPQLQNGPLIVYLTHASWWDAYMLFLLYYRVLHGGYQNYIMMEAKQLRAYRFFAWCGAFSIDRTTPGDAERSIGYIANRLRERNDRCLWIFPQGRIAPPDRRPLVLFPGIARIIAQTGGVTLWPVALRYEFRGNQQPEIFIRCGPVHYETGQTSEGELVEKLSQCLTNAADRLRDDLLENRLDAYQTLLAGRHGLNHWFDSMRMRLSGRSATPRR